MSEDVKEEVVRQVVLEQHQVETFYVDCFAQDQVEHFCDLTNNLRAQYDKYTVDIGGGCGFFASALHQKTGRLLRVIDSDKSSIDRVNRLDDPSIDGVIGDALNPEINGDEEIVCFNLMLHHLVGGNERATRSLQKKALSCWKNHADYVFVNEYIYESYIGNVSGLLIFAITSNWLLSMVGRAIGRVVPSLRANTFGVGVRFRAHREWVELFEECGYGVASKIHGKPEPVAPPWRLLLIKEIRRDSFLLSRKA